MSLDVTLIAPSVCPHCSGPISSGSEVYDANITHNLAEMADAAGIYLACWRPGEMLAPEIHEQIEAQRKADNYHGRGGVFELEKSLPAVRAGDLIEPLRKGLADLRARPEHFKTFDSPNGWGLYEHFVPWVEKYLAACEENPHALVEVSR